VKIFAVYNDGEAGLVRLWFRSWSLRGWVPQLLTPGEVSRAGSPLKAARQRGGSVVTRLSVINFNFRRPRATPRNLPVVKFKKSGWPKAALVDFKTAQSEKEILSCGRPVC
jgi:hypothetical protein